MSESHPHFVPNNLAGSRQETATLLVGTAKEFGIPMRDIASTHSGYWITDALESRLYEDQPEAEPDAEPDTEPDTTKTSGNRAGKKKGSK